MRIIRAPRWTSTGALAVALASGCASTARPVERVSVAPPPASRASALEAILAAARASLGKSHPQVDGQPISTECSGFVRDLYARAGIDLFSEGQPSDGGVRAIARWVERHGGMTREKLPAPGDLAFFDNSYDRNGDGRLNDRLTHVGFVEGVLAGGAAAVRLRGGRRGGGGAPRHPRAKSGGGGGADESPAPARDDGERAAAPQ